MSLERLLHLSLKKSPREDGHRLETTRANRTKEEKSDNKTGLTDLHHQPRDPSRLQHKYQKNKTKGLSGEELTPPRLSSKTH